MSITFIIIGPSGAGKSILTKSLSEKDKHVMNKDLDKEVNDRGPNRLKDAREFIRELESRDDTIVYLVDCGAGFQNPEMKKFYQARQDRLICLYTNHKIIYPRYVKARIDKNINNYQTSVQHETSEYSSEREELYRLATHEIDAASPIENLIIKLQNIVKKSLTNMSSQLKQENK